MFTVVSESLLELSSLEELVDNNVRIEAGTEDVDPRWCRPLRDNSSVAGIVDGDFSHTSVAGGVIGREVDRGTTGPAGLEGRLSMCLREGTRSSWRRDEDASGLVPTEEEERGYGT